MEYIAEELPWQNVFSYGYLGILFALAKNVEIQGLLSNNLFIQEQCKLTTFEKITVAEECHRVLKEGEDE